MLLTAQVCFTLINDFILIKTEKREGGDLSLAADTK